MTFSAVDLPLEKVRLEQRTLLKLLPPDLVNKISKSFGKVDLTRTEPLLLERLLRARAEKLREDEKTRAWLEACVSMFSGHKLATFVDAQVDALPRLDPVTEELTASAWYEGETEILRTHVKAVEQVPREVWRLASYLVWADLVADDTTS